MITNVSPSGARPIGTGSSTVSVSPPATTSLRSRAPLIEPPSPSTSRSSRIICTNPVVVLLMTHVTRRLPSSPTVLSGVAITETRRVTDRAARRRAAGSGGAAAASLHGRPDRRVGRVGLGDRVERRPGLDADDSVDLQAVGLLELADGGLGPRAEDAVDRSRIVAGGNQQLLEVGDELAAGRRAEGPARSRIEAVPGRRAPSTGGQCAERLRQGQPAGVADDAVGAEPRRRLERLDGLLRRRAEVAVGGARVEPRRGERLLQERHPVGRTTSAPQYRRTRRIEPQVSHHRLPNSEVRES